MPRLAHLSDCQALWVLLESIVIITTLFRMRFPLPRFTIVLASLSFALTTFLLPAHAAVNSSPVVQLVSYTDQFGLQVNMLGWGSASIINNQGVILSNNHVVDDGTGQLATAFSVCMTKQAQARPVCDYTASLIARNSDMDISLLKIDPIDVHGKTVDYSQFATLPVDYDYVPTVQNDALIVGYPWIGADTITETKGIVSGTTEYNGFQYIKTDAVIAGGNSGGAMISPAGKLIGIPTFTMGGFFDANLGYGLSIREAKDFIEEHSTQSPEQRTQHVDFAAYQRLLDTINAQGSVTDSLLTYTFPSDYKISNYIKNRALRMESKTQKEIAVYEVSVELEQTPELKTEKEYTYFLEAKGYYTPEWEVLAKRTIGGITMMTPINRGDATKGNRDVFSSYYAQISPTLSLSITVIAPLYDEKNIVRLQDEVTRVLDGLQIKPDTAALEKSFSFSLNKPKVSIESDDRSMVGEYEGSFTEFFGNLYTFASISLTSQDINSGKGLPLEDVIASETEGLDKSLIKRIRLQGSEGYIACQATPESALPYTSMSTPFYALMKDMDGSPLPAMRLCILRVIHGIADSEGEPYNLSMTIAGPSSSISSTVDKALEFLSTKVSLPSSGETILPNPYLTATRLMFNDISDQSDAYKQSLLRMVRYGLLRNALEFHPYMALRWKDFLSLYVRSVYNVQPESTTCRKADSVCFLSEAIIDTPNGAKRVINILRDLSIDLNNYVPSQAIYHFDLLFKAKLAGVSIGDNTETDLQIYTSNPTLARFEETNRALSNLETFLYGERKISMEYLGEWANFSPTRQVVFSPRKGITVQKWTSDTPVSFAPTSSFVVGNYATETYKDYEERYGRAYTELLACSKNLAAVNTCVRTYTMQIAQFMQEDQEELFAYPVMTRAEAYATIMPLMDFALFDSDLAKLKSTSAEEPTE